MRRSRFSLSPIVAYHGCDRNVAESVLAGRTRLRPSDNDYDWLGPGVHFWVDSPERGLQWARDASIRPKSRIKHPYVIGAVVQPGLCLNVTDYGVNEELRFAWQVLSTSMNTTATPMP